MDYFLSHIGIIFIAAVFVAVCAVLWWYLTEKNALLIRKRAELRRKAAESDAQHRNSDTDKNN